MLPDHVAKVSVEGDGSQRRQAHKEQDRVLHFTPAMLLCAARQSRRSAGPLVL